MQRLSELVADNEALRESERNWRLVLDNIPGMVAVLAADGTAQFVNRRIIEYTGITRLEEFKEWGTNGTLHPEDLAHVAEALTKSLASGSRTRSSTESGGQTASIVGFRAAVFSVAMPAARPFSGAPC